MEEEKGAVYSGKPSVKGYGGGKGSCILKESQCERAWRRKGNCILKESQYERVWRRKKELHTQRKPV